MRRLIGLAAVLAMTFGLLSCGGGGGGGGSNPPGITVRAGERLTTNVGNATITSGVFPNTGTVTIAEKQAPKVAQPNFGTLQPMFTITSTVQPDDGFTVSYPDTSNGAPVIAGIFNGKEPIGAFPVTKQNGQLVVAVDPAYLPENRGRGISLVSIVLGIIRNYFPPDSSVRLRQVGAQGEGQSLVYVPGLLQNADSAESTVSSVKQDRGYGTAYVVDYDWRAPIDEVGQNLANALTVLPSKNAELVGYSKGGLVGRWALEELGATKPVKRAVFMGSPNTGCALTLAALYGLLAATFLKSAVALPMVFDPTDNCLTELMPGSQRLTQLNSAVYKQNGKVDYHFVAGQFGGFQTDLVVGTDSALLTGSSTIGNRTNGTVRRFTMDGQSHFTLDEAPAINAAFQKVATASEGIKVSVDNNPVEASHITGHWYYEITITNNTGQDAALETFQFEGFDIISFWAYNAWYNPLTPDGVAFRHDDHAESV